MSISRVEQTLSTSWCPSASIRKQLTPTFPATLDAGKNDVTLIGKSTFKFTSADVEADSILRSLRPTGTVGILINTRTSPGLANVLYAICQECLDSASQPPGLTAAAVTQSITVSEDQPKSTDQLGVESFSNVDSDTHFGRESETQVGQDTESPNQLQYGEYKTMIKGKPRRVLLFESVSDMQRGIHRDITSEYTEWLNMGGDVGVSEPERYTLEEVQTCATNMDIETVFVLTDPCTVPKAPKAGSSPCKVVVVPIHCHSNSVASIPLGFDTLARVNAEIVGNISSEVATVQERYHMFFYTGEFDTMGVTLELMLQCRPNLVLFRSSLQEHHTLWSFLKDVGGEVANVVLTRLAKNKRYGIVFFGNTLQLMRTLLKQQAVKSAEASKSVTEAPKSVSDLLKSSAPDDEDEDIVDDVPLDWPESLRTRIENLTKDSSDSDCARTCMAVFRYEIEQRRLAAEIELKSNPSQQNLSRAGNSYALTVNASNHSLHHTQTDGNRSLEQRGPGLAIVSKIRSPDTYSHKSRDTTGFNHNRSNPALGLAQTSSPTLLHVQPADAQRWSILSADGLVNVHIPKMKMILHELNDQALCSMPSNFDASYGYTLGRAAALCSKIMHTAEMVTSNKEADKTMSTSAAACMATFAKENLCIVCVDQSRATVSAAEWEVGGCFTADRIRRSDPRYEAFVTENKKAVEVWHLHDYYRNVGPLQIMSFGRYDPPLLTANLEPDHLIPSGSNAAKGARFPMFFRALSPLQQDRLRHRPSINPMLLAPKVRATYRVTYPTLTIEHEKNISRWVPEQTERIGLAVRGFEVDPNFNPPWHQKIGVVLAGQPASGVSNILFGLYERTTTNSSSILGFHSVDGLLNKKYTLLNREMLNTYINGSCFELLGHSMDARHVMRTETGLEAVRSTCTDLGLDGLVLIGGMTTATDCVYLTEHLIKHDCKTDVVFVPANQEFNVQSPLVEMTLGFDSRCQVSSTRIGEIVNFTRTCKTPQWSIARVSGKCPTRTIIEIALRTHPDMVVIPEMYSKTGLAGAIQDIVATIRRCERNGKRYGIVLVPSDIVAKLSSATHLADVAQETPSEVALKEIKTWPLEVQKILPKLQQEIENTGFAVEALIAAWVATLVPDVSVKGVQFSYGGRSSIPSNFDCALGYSLGYLAAILVECNLTGLMTSLRGLCKHPTQWRPTAVPVACLLNSPSFRDVVLYGKDVPMVCSPRLDPHGSVTIRAILKHLYIWQSGVAYSDVGPLQFGDVNVSCQRPLSLLLKTEEEEHTLDESKRILTMISRQLEVGVHYGVASSLQESLQTLKDYISHRV